MSPYLLVAAGGALGSVLRYATYVLMAGFSGFPWGTLAVNYIGSFIIGWIAATGPSPNARLLVMTGICGGFTTFSAFSLDTVSLIRDGQPAKAFVYVGASVVGCLVATWLGFRVKG